LLPKLQGMHQAWQQLQLIQQDAAQIVLHVLSTRHQVEEIDPCHVCTIAVASLQWPQSMLPLATENLAEGYNKQKYA